MCPVKLCAAFICNFHGGALRERFIFLFPHKAFLTERQAQPWNLCGPVNYVLCVFCVAAGPEDDACKVLVLSYPQYCRYRSVLARLREQPSSLLIDHTVLALGGIAALGGNTRILYCRDTFEHPTLLQNESICDEFGECDGSRSSWIAEIGYRAQLLLAGVWVVTVRPHKTSDSSYSGL